MALDLQQRPAQHGHRWDYTRNQTENGRVVLQADPIKNGGITSRLDFLILDELGYLPFAQTGGQLLFHLISKLKSEPQLSLQQTSLLANGQASLAMQK